MKVLNKDLGSYKLHLINTDKFKTVTVKVVFHTPIKKDEITKKTLVTNLLLQSSSKYDSRRKLTIEAEELYSADVSVSNQRLGNYIATSFNLQVLMDRYTEEGNLEKSLDFLHEIIFNPDVEKKSFNKEKVAFVKHDSLIKINSIKESPSRYGSMRLGEVFDSKSPISYRMVGYIDDKGVYIINPQFVDAYSFYDKELAPVAIMENDYIIDSKKWGYINRKGDLIIDYTFDKCRPFAKNGLASVAQYNHDTFWYRIGFIDQAGEYVINPQFEYDPKIDDENMPYFDENGYAVVKMVDGKYGMIDKTGKFIINPQFDEFYNFRDKDLALIKLNDKWGYIEKTGRIVINPQFDYARTFAENDLARVKVNDKWGYIDKHGKYIINPQFDWADAFDDEMAAIELNNKYGFIDATGKIIINTQFEDIYYYYEDDILIIFACQDEKWGIIDKQGKWIANPQFDEVRYRPNSK